MPKTIATTPSWYWPDRVPRVLGVPPYRLDELLIDRWIRRRPSQTSLVGDVRFSLADLQRAVHGGAGAIARAVPDDGFVAVGAGTTAEGAVLVLAALSSGRRAVLVPPNQTASADHPLAGAALALSDGPGSGRLEAAGLKPVRLEGLLAMGAAGENGAAAREGAGGGDGPAGSQSVSGASHSLADLKAPIVCVGGRFAPAWHSHRSLLAGAIAFNAFLGTTSESSWLSTYSPCTWEGLSALIACLEAGATLVLADPGDAAAEATVANQPTWLYSSLEDGARTWGGKRQKRTPSDPRGALLMVDGPFNPDDRRTVAPAASGTALTLFGIPEVGLVFASHPSWYLDESVGIPVPNMHVVPADPDTSIPISTMWELVDHAMVTAWSPSLAVGCGDTGEDKDASRFAGSRFVTGVLAASDPNGMLYLVDA